MKDEIKEIKNRAISYKVYDGELRKANFTAKEILTIIAEIEFLETEIQELKEVQNIAASVTAKHQTEIKQLQAVREAAEKYRKVARPIIDFYAAETLGGELTEKEIEILNEFDEALAAKGK